MKHNQAPTIDPEQPVDLEYQPTWQDHPFIIRNIDLPEAETIQKAVEADFATQAVHHEALKRKRPTAAPEAPQVTYTEPTKTDRIKQYFADAHVRKFDKQHGSNLYGELLEQRRRDALFLKASQIGLLGTDSDYYKAKLKKLAKATVQA